MSKNSVLTICNEVIQPGEKVNLALQMPDLYSCAPLYMPIKVMHSKNAGPCLLIFATINGNEMNGLEIVNRLMNALNINEISGTIIAVPVLNVYGLTHYPKTIPSGQNLADCFPGKSDGNYGERIAHFFTEELIKKSNYCIELQSGSLNHNILPQVYCNFSSEQSKLLAKAFQVPVITDMNLKQNKLRQTMEDFGIPLIVYQAGEAMRFDESAINLGIMGITNIMREIDVLPKEELPQKIKTVFSHEEEWLVAHKGGILHINVELGQAISKNDKIAIITDPFSADLEEIVRATKDGIIVGINMTPLIHEGLPLFKIASFVDDDKAENIIESWEQHQIAEGH